MQINLIDPMQNNAINFLNHARDYLKSKFIN